MSARILAQSEHFSILQINETIRFLFPNGEKLDFPLDHFNELSNNEIMKALEQHI